MARGRRYRCLAMPLDRPLSCRAAGLGQAGRERFFASRLRFKNLEELNALLLETASAPCPASAGPERAEDVFHRLRIGAKLIRMRARSRKRVARAPHQALSVRIGAACCKSVCLEGQRYDVPFIG